MPLFIFPLITAGFENRGLKGDCILCDLAGKVNIEELETRIRKLSGAETIDIGFGPVMIETRYTFSDQKLLALEYLRREAAEYGYETEVQSFVLEIFRRDLLGLALSGGRDTLWAGTVDGRVYRSVYQDGWERFGKCAFLDSVEIYSLKAGPDGRLWAGCGYQQEPQGALYFSDDGGESWEKKIDGLHVYSLYSISFLNDQSGIAVGGTGTLLLTANGGDDWIIKDPSVFVWRDLNDSAPGGSVYWVVAERGGLYWSDDYGVSWNDTLFTNPSLNSVAFSDSLHGIIAADGSLFYTFDGGRMWNEVTLGVNFTGVDIAGPSIAAACSEEGDIYVTHDGGVNWEKLPEECAGTGGKYDLVFSGENLFLSIGEDTVRNIVIEDDTSYICRAEAVADSIIGKNLIFRHKGIISPEQRVVLCAHYDSYNWKDPYNIAPGADDNATGVAGVLACAGALAGSMTDYTIEFILFDGEEKGLLGSKFFVENIDTAAVYRGVFNLDMLGRDYSGDGWAVGIAGRDEANDSVLSRKLTESALILNLNIKPEYLSFSPASDHQSFWQLDDVPAVLLIEGGFRDNPYIHLSQDRVEHIDFEYLKECVQVSLAAVACEAGYKGVRPQTVMLYQNFPNPFSGKTKIRFELPDLLPVTLAVFDVSGRKVADLIKDNIGPGRIEYVWNGRNNRGREVASGVYFLKMHAGNYLRTRKIVYLK